MHLVTADHPNMHVVVHLSIPYPSLSCPLMDLHILQFKLVLGSEPFRIPYCFNKSMNELSVKAFCLIVKWAIFNGCVNKQTETER